MASVLARPYRNIARIVKTQGRNGEVVAVALRGLPFSLRPGMQVALTPPALDRDRFVSVEAFSALDDDSARVRFSGCSSIADAEGLVGCLVLAHAEDLELSELDIAFDELIGRAVEDVRYGNLGSIREVMETPANDVWVVDGGGYGEVLLPVIPQVVDEIPPAGPITVRALDGLIEA